MSLHENNTYIFLFSPLPYTKDSIIYISSFFILPWALLPIWIDLWCSPSFLPVLEYSAFMWNPWSVGFCPIYWCWICGRTKCDTLDARAWECLQSSGAGMASSHWDRLEGNRAKVTLTSPLRHPVLRCLSRGAWLWEWVGRRVSETREKQLLWKTLALVKAHPQKIEV